MCTSLARDSIASSRISFTSRTTEASWASSESSAVDVDLVEQLDVLFVLQGHQAVDRLAADAEVGLDQLGDFARAGQHRLDRQARRRRSVRRAGRDRTGRWWPRQRAVLPVESGNSDWRWISLSGKPCSSDRSILLLLQVDEGDADLVAQGPERGLFAHQAQVDGGHVEPRGIRPIDAGAD